MQFQEIIALPSRALISVCSMSCAENAISPEKIAKNRKTLNILAIFLLANFLAYRVARLQFFPRDGNAIIFENCIVLTSEKLPVKPQL